MIDMLDNSSEIDRKTVEKSIKGARLSQRQVQVVRLVLYKGFSLFDVSKKIGVTKQCVHKTFVVALSKLKNFRKSHNPKNG